MSRHNPVSAGNTTETATAIGASAAPPVVTTTLGYTFLGGALDGFVTSTFQGYDPAVTGQLTLALGATAYQAPASIAQAAPLAHVQAITPVVAASSLVDLAFTTPGQGFGFGAETASNTDIGISSSTAGLSGILGPLTAALAGTALGNELAPIVSFGKGLLPSLDRNGGLPHGGVLGAKPYFAVGAGIGLSQSVTVLGQTTTQTQSGSLALNGKTGAQAASALADTAGLLSSAGTLLADVQAGNLLGAIPAGVGALASAATLGTALGPLLADAVRQHNPQLPAIRNPALDLNLQTGLGQTFSLGIGDPASISETLGVHITADTFGAYALGKLLAQIAPQLIADLQSQGTIRQPLDVLSQLANGVSTLATDASQGFAGLGNAGAIPSSTHADISIQISLGVTETQPTVLGSISNTQTFSTELQTNAQGFYDLGTAAQPVLTDLLLGLLETPAGHEVLQIGGDILAQLDQKLGGAGSAHAAIGTAHGFMASSAWHHG